MMIYGCRTSRRTGGVERVGQASDAGAIGQQFHPRRAGKRRCRLGMRRGGLVDRSDFRAGRKGGLDDRGAEAAERAGDGDFSRRGTHWRQPCKVGAHRSAALCESPRRCGACRCIQARKPQALAEWIVQLTRPIAPLSMPPDPDDTITRRIAVGVGVAAVAPGHSSAW